MITSTFIYLKYQRLSRLITESEKRAMADAFPETGGNSLYVHNWIICGGTAKGREPGQAEKAQAIRDDHHNRWQHIKARQVRESSRVEHAQHVVEQRDGYYLWCKPCMKAA